MLSSTLLDMSYELGISPALLARLIIKEYLCQQNYAHRNDGGSLHVKNGMCTIAVQGDFDITCILIIFVLALRFEFFLENYYQLKEFRLDGFQLVVLVFAYLW